MLQDPPVFMIMIPTLHRSAHIWSKIEKQLFHQSEELCGKRYCKPHSAYLTLIWVPNVSGTKDLFTEKQCLLVFGFRIQVSGLFRRIFGSHPSNGNATHTRFDFSINYYCYEL